MNFTAFYGAKHGEAVMEMLANYTDYTPFEKVQPDTESTRFSFEDAHVKESSGVYQFCALDDDDGKAIGFININKTEMKVPAWLIEELFVSKSVDGNTMAKEMVEKLIVMLKGEDIRKICSYVYPSFDDILSFWEGLGFVQDPLVKRLNASDERLIVLSKDI